MGAGAGTRPSGPPGGAPAIAGHGEPAARGDSGEATAGRRQGAAAEARTRGARERARQRGLSGARRWARPAHG